MFRESSKRELDNFLHNVAWLRMHHGLSKKKMANLLEISVGTLSKIESGELPLRLDVGIFFKLAYHFGISPPDILRQRF